MADSRRVLVTGGAGFVGATLVRRLGGTGYLVRVLDNYSTGDPSYLDGVDAELVEGDTREDGVRRTWRWFQESVFGS
jgi:UDP-glucose 4-epimerase